MKKRRSGFPQQTLDRLAKAKEKTGLTVSELIRRAVDDYLDRIERGAGHA